MPKKIINFTKRYLPFIGIIIFIYVVYSLDVHKLIDAILQIHPVFIFFAVILTIPRIIIRNYAWQLIQKEQNIRLPYLQSLKIFLMSFFYMSITPGYIGQLTRVPFMKEKTNEPYGKLFVNSLIESLLHTFSLYIMMVIGALLVASKYPFLFNYTVAWIIIVTVILLYFIKKERGEKLFKKLIKYTIPKAYKKYLNSFVYTFYNDFPNLQKLVLPFFVSSLTWIIIFTQEYLFVIALGLDIPYIHFLFLFPIANTIGFIPITSAGLGLREAAAILIFTNLYVVTSEQVFVVALVGFIMTDLFTGFIGFFVTLSETGRHHVLNPLMKGQ